MAEGAVFDLGYQRHEGLRLGRRGALRALVYDGLRRVFWLRRRLRRKVMPFLLVAIAVLPALFFVAIGVIAGEFDASATLFGHPEAEATRLMLQVHHEGRAIVASGPLEKAESDCHRLHHHGLWATLERS